MEGSSMVALEAASVGQVCIATDVGGISEVVHHGSMGILVPPRDPQALAKAVLFSIHHPEEVDRTGKEARRIFFERFTLDRMVRETVAVYQSLA